MTDQERGLLLATARVLRAQIRGKNHLTNIDIDDAKALTEALAPFDPDPGGVVGNKSNRSTGC